MLLQGSAVWPRLVTYRVSVSGVGLCLGPSVERRSH